MYRTIQIAGHVTAQGLWLRTLSDGREVIDLGDRIVVGRPIAATRRAVARLRAAAIA